MKSMDKKELAGLLRGRVANDGDDLERANHAFRGMTKRQLDSQWGQSGKTAREIWQEYKDERQRTTQALTFLNQMLEKEGL